MNISYIMAFFALLAALDRIIGNKFGLGKEFEKGITLLGTMALSMVGMIVISPVIAGMMQGITGILPDFIDPSLIPATLFANDMGGAPLAVEMAKNPQIGSFNALVVSAMMGATISFTIPFALGVVPEKNQKDMLFGILCGITTIPVGCFFAGLISGISVVTLIVDIVPIIVFSGIIAVGLLKIPAVCVKIFNFLGIIIKILITIGLAVGIFEFLTGITLIKGTAPLMDGMDIIINASCVMAGAFPLIYIISKLLSKPLKAIGKLTGINEISAIGIVSSLATNVTTFNIMKDMDRKGIVINSAFAVSGAFTFAGHLAFTMAFDSSFVVPVIAGKLIAGFTSIIVAVFMYNKAYKNKEESV